MENVNYHTKLILLLQNVPVVYRLLKNGNQLDWRNTSCIAVINGYLKHLGDECHACGDD